MNDSPKTLDPNFYHQLAECINALGEREFYGKFFTMIKSIAKIDQYMVFEFSEREAQICDQILQGHTAKSIANKLGLSEDTVITYKNRAFKKLKISHKSELVQYLQ